MRGRARAAEPSDQGPGDEIRLVCVRVAITLSAIGGYQLRGAARTTRIEIGEAHLELVLESRQFREARLHLDQALFVHAAELLRRLLRGGRRLPALHQRADLRE